MQANRILLCAVVASASAWARAQAPIDPDNRFAWAPNVGWTNFGGETAEDVVVFETYLTGLVWAENVGWINVGNGPPADGIHFGNTSGLDFGVNVDPVTGDLFGLAWGENIGWINFDTRSLDEQRARLSFCDHRFYGFAWGENVGWLNLDDATHFVAEGPCDTFDLRCDGTVASDDFAAFVGEFEGPGIPIGCSVFDADLDGDVDLLDAAEFQVAQSAAD